MYPDTVGECDATNGDGLEEERDLLVIALPSESGTCSGLLRGDEVVDILRAGDTSRVVSERHICSGALDVERRLEKYVLENASHSKLL